MAQSVVRTPEPENLTCLTVPGQILRNCGASPRVQRPENLSSVAEGQRLSAHSSKRENEEKPMSLPLPFSFALSLASWMSPTHLGGGGGQISSTSV